MTEPIFIDADFEIEVCGFSESGVHIKIKLRRHRQEGFRETSLNAMFAGDILKSEEYSALPEGSMIVFEGVKVPVEVKE